MAEESFYDTDELGQLAINLFYGWGYNFYRVENQLRADDLMVRSKICEFLATARARIQTAEMAYREENLPAPTRADPYPDPAAVRGARLLESLGSDIGTLESRIRAQPVPENDRMTQRIRTEATTLANLLEADKSLVGHAEMLRAQLTAATPAWILQNTEKLRAHLSEISKSLQNRANLLTIS